MAIYECSDCGFRYDEEREGILFKDLAEDWKCPICGADKSLFELVEGGDLTTDIEVKIDENDLSLPRELVINNKGVMGEIHKISESGKSTTEPMETLEEITGFEDILLLGAQLSVTPLDDDEFVRSQTVIGKKAKRPMVIESPIYVSHMSFGALSREAKFALSKGAAMAKTAMCSGEGGILPEEKEAAYKYIFEYIPNLYSVTDENLKSSDAIEIKIGQGTKPGMGGHLPGEKVTEEIAKIRGKNVGEDIKSPSHFKDIKTPDDLKKLVDNLRERSEGRPIGVKIAAGRIEEDLKFILHSNPDFITIDGRGGATGSSPKFLKDNSSVPTVYALHRAVKYLNANNSDIDLIITGGLRTSGDFAKCLAMGATAIAVASAPLMALGCQRYRLCHNDRCPMGIATQDENLRKRLDIEKGSKRVANYFNVSTEEIKILARCTGHKDVHDFSTDDIETTSLEISENTNINHC
ncbi:glutamate synthase-related protein [Peptostreptococcus faecalis]|uniref:glutamate synthase-related protein n=1 Tax=Peptostreptococcus faecalis TaxID=2045015 RepID=UPI000C79E47C|nr:glutamate synthase-related protein [Peptostreptococcus faecalis]